MNKKKIVEKHIDDLESYALQLEADGQRHFAYDLYDVIDFLKENKQLREEIESLRAEHEKLKRKYFGLRTTTNHLLSKEEKRHEIYKGKVKDA